MANRISITLNSQYQPARKRKLAEHPTMLPASMSPSTKLSCYGMANNAAFKAGNESALLAGRRVWNLDDFDAANMEFERMMDSLTRGMGVDKKGRVQ
jgi:hypothetical protein